MGVWDNDLGRGQEQASGPITQPREGLGRLGEGACQIQEDRGEALNLRRPRLVEWANSGLTEKSRPLV